MAKKKKEEAEKHFSELFDEKPCNWQLADYADYVDSADSADSAYIAGFLDGDGCVNAQIVARSDYRLKYQIRLSVTFFQRCKRRWLLLWLKKKIGSGTIRDRGDGMCEYAVVGPQGVKTLLRKLFPFLKGKHRQAMLALSIIERLSRNQSKEDFLRLCRVADKFALLNDSKGRTITTQVVEKTLGDL